MVRYDNNKWGKTRLLNRSKELARFVPETRKASKEALDSMLKTYGMVYVKPSLGTGGFGIMKAEMVKNGKLTNYVYTHNTRTYRFGKFDAFVKSMQGKFGRRTYLVQKGIRMLRYNNRPFDIRIMVQKNEQNKWEHTGTIGRVAHPRRIVTNYHNGGTPLPLPVLLKPHLNANESKTLQKELSDLGLKVAAHMQTAFPRLKEIGVDVGLDRNCFPWIFEVNSRPDPFIFLKLRNSKVFRRVMRLTRLHGRFLPKKTRTPRPAHKSSGRRAKRIPTKKGASGAP